MKKENLLLYPPLIGLFPILAIYSANQGVLPPGAVVRPALIALGAQCALWLLASAILRSYSRGAIVSTMLQFCLFSYGWVRNWIGPNNFDTFDATVYFLVSALLIGLAGWKWKWHHALNVFSCCLMIASIGSVGIQLSKSAAFRLRAMTVTAKRENVAERPDIFYIILDGYGRSDALKRSLGFDNSAFVSALESRGFYVAKAARSNYCQTEISLASSLNFDYIPNLVEKINPHASSRKPFDALIDDSRVAHELRTLDYKVVTVTTGFPPVKLSTADEKHEGASATSMFENLLIEMTPFAGIRSANDSMYAQRRVLLQNTFRSLKDLARRETRPRFVFAHILCPHPPFVFDALGGPERQRGPFGFWDGSDWMSFSGSKADYAKRYAAQAEYLDARMIEVVDALLASSGPKPVIILQGDHGSKKGLDQDLLTKTDVNECFPNLNALLVPRTTRAALYDGITPVNSFRILFNTLFGDKHPMLPDRSWYSPFSRPFEFTEVTNRVK